jgi:hypothetical protein
MACLIAAEREVITSQAKFDRIPKRRTADDFNSGPVAETHLEQSASDIGVARDGNDLTAAADGKLIQSAGLFASLRFATGY